MKNYFEDKKFSLLIIAAIISFNLLLIFIGPVNKDEGTYLTGGMITLRGGIPSVDFSNNKPPGIYWLIAALFYFFGTSLYAAKLAILLVNSVTALLIYEILKKLLIRERLRIVLVIFFWLAIVGYDGSNVITEPPMLLFGILSILLLMKYYEKKSDKLLFFSGLALGISLLFKQTAVFIFLTSLFFIFINRPKSEKLITRALTKQLVYITGFLIPLSAVIIYYLQKESIVYLINNTITSLYSYPTEGLKNWQIQFLAHDFYLKLFWIASIALLFLSLRKSSAFRQAPWNCFFSALFVLFLLPALVRPYAHYYIPLAIFSLFFTGIWCDKWKNGEKIFSSATKTITKLIIGYFAIIAISSFSIIVYNLFNYNLDYQNRVAGYIKSITNKDEEIYIFGYSPQYYFLSGRNPADKNFFLLSDYSVSHKVENDVIKNLKKEKINYIFTDSHIGNEYFTDFNEFIQSDYRLINKIGDLKVYKRIYDAK